MDQKFVYFPYFDQYMKCLIIMLIAFSNKAKNVNMDRILSIYGDTINCSLEPSFVKVCTTEQVSSKKH